MLYATTKLLFAILVFISTINIAYAFDIKQVLFGNKAAANDKSTASFGRPVKERPSSSNRADIPCEHYICEDTGACVSTPFECPCRLETDIKCEIGDWYTCIRGDQSCSSVQ
ncbi:hypothetical protein V8B55DRAFT_1471717 [Mucor lusitanicus]|uniref:Long chronological lifespan protein 2 n=2 Tax=Mucor circinelloides f. lusitanicus TaxID=29924 RepID=A0A168P9Z7_MUCCL|nr:hypothetical protein FB192DRAFT_1446347 [Mucor lusitanicus]OAD07414.1 hypothetical protein MUCCIDRAFT_104343 [Mucor lusitanicus CBS 277.49]